MGGTQIAVTSGGAQARGGDPGSHCGGSGGRCGRKGGARSGLEDHALLFATLVGEPSMERGRGVCRR